jgi:hypothetical protein
MTPSNAAISTHPANSGILRHLASNARHLRLQKQEEFSCSPESVSDPYTRLGTHPDLVSRLWDEITVSLPTRCKWIVYGAPVLVRPDSGVIFAFAGGSLTYALRLPQELLAEFFSAALEKANKNADGIGLAGEDRERYLATHTGSVWRYSDGSTLDLRDIGEGWVFGRWLEGEVHWCRRAYEFAV